MNTNYHFNQPVMTPAGPGLIIAGVLQEGKELYLVSHHYKQLTPEAQAIVPDNQKGAILHRTYDRLEIESINSVTKGV